MGIEGGKGHGYEKLINIKRKTFPKTLAPDCTLSNMFNFIFGWQGTSSPSLHDDLSWKDLEAEASKSCFPLLRRQLPECYLLLSRNRLQVSGQGSAIRTDSLSPSECWCLVDRGVSIQLWLIFMHSTFTHFTFSIRIIRGGCLGLPSVGGSFVLSGL